MQPLPSAAGLVHQLDNAQEPSPVRKPSDATHQYGAAASSSSVALSVNDLHVALGEVAANCAYCGDQIIGTSFNPLTLVETFARNKRLASQPMPQHDDDGDDDDYDDDDAMETTDAPQQEMSPVMRMMSIRLQCCSGPCWMAESLARYGEKSPLGKVLLAAFPGLSPHTIGGRTLAIYTQRYQKVQQEVFARAMAQQAAITAADVAPPPPVFAPATPYPVVDLMDE